MVRMVLLATCLALPARADTLRPFVSLDASVVRLSDLFAGAPDRVLGAAPAPGQRIVVEAPQLAAIARQFGVDWRPASPADRAVLERAGRALSADEVVALLRPALLAAGAPAEADIDLPAFAPPMAPLHGGATRVAQLDYDAAAGRFTAVLSTESGDAPPSLARVSGRVQETIEIVAPARRLLAGEPIAAADLRPMRVRAAQVVGEVARTAEQAAGLASRRVLQPGAPIALADLGHAVVVAKGAAILLTLDTPGIAVAAQAIAAEAGGVGERIHVLNPASKAVVVAEVTGPGRARVSPGSAPVSGPAAERARTQVAVR